MKQERVSNILVAVIDGEKLGDQALAELRKSDGDKLPSTAKLEPQFGLGFVKTAKGTFFLDTEGTGGGEPVETEPVEIPLSRSDIISIMPTVVMKCDKAEAEALPVLPQKVPLKNFIRSFGHRLECNFNAWQSHLEKSQPLPEFLEKVPETP